MTQQLIDLCVGFLAGGLVLSAAWGFFWLMISLVGLSRGTCGWRVVLQGLISGVVPLFFVVALMWWSGVNAGMTAWFRVGLAGMPAVLLGFWLRRMPDGQRAGTHLVAGVRHLMDELLGLHRACGGCDHAHDHETGR